MSVASPVAITPPSPAEGSAWPRRGVLLILGFAMAAAVLLTGCQGPPPPRLVVVLVVDTLRADRLGCYGYADAETPNIDRLAAQGTLYTNAFCAVPVTLPSVATMLTGAYPLQHGVRDNTIFELPESWETLPERFASAGFATGAFVSADVLGRRFGLDGGFDVYDDDMSMRYRTYHPMMRQMEDDLQHRERRAHVTVGRALDWAETQVGRDVFLLVHFFDPHLPRDPLPEFHAIFPDRPYDAEIAAVDQQIGRLLEGLAEHWDTASTYTLFASDHGEGLSDHEEELHGVLLFDETMHVPLIVAGAGVPTGVRREEVVRTIDLAPTMCAWFGLGPLPAAVGSLLPGLPYADEAVSWRRRYDDLAYLESMRSRLSHDWCEQRGLRSARWKFIESTAPELYDLAADPEERENLAPRHPGRVDSLRTLMNHVGLYAAARGARAAATREPSDEERERLLSLGYLTPEGGAEQTVDSLAVWYFPPGERGAEIGMPDPRVRLREYMQRTVARSLVRSGEAALTAGNERAAMDFFSKALEANPTVVSAHLGIAQALERVGRPDDALAALRNARETVPASDRVALALGRTLRDRGMIAEAIRVLEEAAQYARGAGRPDSIFHEDLRALRRRLEATSGGSGVPD